MEMEHVGAPESSLHNTGTRFLNRELVSARKRENNKDWKGREGAPLTRKERAYEKREQSVQPSRTLSFSDTYHKGCVTK